MKAKYSNLLKIVLTKFDIKYSKLALERDFITNPNNNNFYGLSQLIEKFGLKTDAIPTSFKDFLQVQKPTLIQLTKPFGICAVSKINGDAIEGVDDKGNKFKYQSAYLAQRWSGNVMYITKDEFQKVETVFIEQVSDYFKSNLEWFVLVVLILSFFKNLVSDGFAPASLILFITSLAGLIISQQLLKLKDPDFESKICTVMQKGDCKSITSSTKFLGFFDYDKIGIVYFLGFCAVPIFSTYQVAVPLLLLISAGAALFPIYSIYYQKYIEKKWCILCLMVQVCLIVNFLVLSFSYQDLTINLTTAFNLALCFLFMLIVSNYYFSTVSSKNDYTITLNRLNKFIRNEEVFNFLLDKNEKHSGDRDESTIIVKKERENEVIFVTNPFCKHCNESYKIAKELITTNDSFSLKMIYLSGKNDIAHLICKQFISIYFLKGEEAYLKAVEEWYDWGFKDYKKWKLIYEIEEYVKANDILVANENWAISSKIHATPTLLLNNRIVPVEYQIADFKYF